MSNKFFYSRTYKLLANRIYGFGAAIVLIGALFKMMHFPGAGVLLTLGLLMEAFIFILSSFEPPVEHFSGGGAGENKNVPEKMEELQSQGKEMKVALEEIKQFGQEARELAGHMHVLNEMFRGMKEVIKKS